MDNYISYQFDNDFIWKKVREKVESFGISEDDVIYKLSELTIKNGLLVLNLLKRYDIFPVRINAGDDDLFINFCTYDKDYNIDIEGDEMTFYIDTKYCFKRKNSKGTVESTFECWECNLGTIKDYLSDVKRDTFEDLENLIKMIGELPCNWHINYEKSNVISKDMIDDSFKILNVLGKSAIKPYAIFPGVLDMDGNVCVRFCIRMSDRYFLEVQGGGKFLLRKFDILENKEECKYSFDFNEVKRYIVSLVDGALAVVDLSVQTYSF